MELPAAQVNEWATWSDWGAVLQEVAAATGGGEKFWVGLDAVLRQRAALARGRPLLAVFRCSPDDISGGAQGIRLARESLLPGDLGARVRWFLDREEANAYQAGLAGAVPWGGPTL